MELVYFTAFVFVLTFAYSLGRIFAQSDVIAKAQWMARHEGKEQ